jgi:hypothetical protein
MLTRGQSERKEELAKDITKKERKLERAQRELEAARFAYDNLPDVKQEKKEKKERQAKESAKKRRDAVREQLKGWADDVAIVDEWAADWLREEGVKIAQGLTVFAEHYSDIAFGMGSMDSIAVCPVGVPGRDAIRYIEISRNGHGEVECVDLPNTGLHLLNKTNSWKEFVEDVWSKTVLREIVPSDVLDEVQATRGTSRAREGVEMIESVLIPYFVYNFAECIGDFVIDD